MIIFMLPSLPFPDRPLNQRIKQGNREKSMVDHGQVPKSICVRGKKKTQNKKIINT